MVDKSVIDTIQNYLQLASKSGIHISEAILFGSYAKDNSDEDSDLDLLLVCSDFNEDSSEEIKNKLWSLRSKTDSRIEPIPVAESEWDKGAGGIIADIARKEGIRIAGSGKR
ncbi:MAG: nucleotidyltransferase domain-containing protein [Thermodesulfobacteriota bacterium]